MKRDSIRHHRPGLLVTLGLLALVACDAGPPPTGTAITNVTVVDARNGARAGQTVVFDGDRIVAVAPAADAPQAAVEIDGTGGFLIPGLWDMHVHLTYDDRFTPIMAESFLRWGVTSVRDTGGLLEKILPVVEAMRDDGNVAPRVYFSGPLLDGARVVYDGGVRPHIGIANPTPEVAKQNVAMLAEAGVDLIKIYEMVEPDVFEAIVEAAGERGLPITAHVPLSMLASDAVPAVQSMEHLRNVEIGCSAEADALLAERREMLDGPWDGPTFELRAAIHAAQRQRGFDTYDAARCEALFDAMQSTIQVPTARLNTIELRAPFERDDWDEALAEMPDEIRQEWAEPPAGYAADPGRRNTAFGKFTLDLIRRMHEAGVPIGAGTDTPIGYAIPGYSLHNELLVLAEAGLSPLEALRAATLRPAEFLSLQDEMGSVEAGMRADLVLLDADPLEDIRNTRSIRLVVSQGRVIPVAAE